MTWVFTPANALTVKRWAEKGSRDGERKLLWAPMMYGDNPNAMRNPGYNKLVRGAIEVITDFQGKTGDRVTIPNVRVVEGRGVHNDAILRGSGAPQALDSMDVYFENVAHQVLSGGKLSERRIALDFRRTVRRSLTDWYHRKVEESIILALWGLTSWYRGTNTTPQNYGPLRNFNNSGETHSMLNAIQAFDSDHIMYAGDATSDATLDSSDVMSAQLITKMETKAMEDLDIPLEPLMTEDGEECFGLVLSNKQLEDLSYDEDFVRRNTQVVPRDGNPLTKRAIGKYSNTYIIPYAKCLQPIVNVTRAIFFGANCLKFAKVDEMEFFEDFADDAKRRVALSVGGAWGVAPAYFNSSRRNCIAVDTWTRAAA